MLNTIRCVSTVLVCQIFRIEIILGMDDTQGTQLVQTSTITRNSKWKKYMPILYDTIA